MMFKRFILEMPALALGAFLSMTACGGVEQDLDTEDTSLSEDAIVTSSVNAYVTEGTKLRGFNIDRPRQMQATITISGMVEQGETIRAIDFRPATGGLYGISDRSRLYLIDPATGAASQVGVDGTFLLTSTDDIGMDFNPVPDRIRVVTKEGQNLRLNPANATLPLVPPVTGVPTPDGNLNGDITGASAAGYTNSFAGPAPATTQLFVMRQLDSTTIALDLQNPPNAGTTTRIATLSLPAPISGSLSFDVMAPNTGYLSVQLGNGKSAAAQLYRIDLTTGQATFVGPLSGLRGLTGLAIVPAPAAI